MSDYENEDKRDGREKKPRRETRGQVIARERRDQMTARLDKRGGKGEHTEDRRKRIRTSEREREKKIQGHLYTCCSGRDGA